MTIRPLAYIAVCLIAPVAALAQEVDPDELFASGKAWGVTVRRVAVS